MLKADKKGKPPVKRPLAGKITLQVAIVCVIALAVLFTGVFYLVSKIARDESIRYAKNLASLYADVVLYKEEGFDIVFDDAFLKAAAACGNYICSWYRVDAAYMFIPEPENGTVTYFSMTRADSSQNPDSILPAGTVVRRQLTAEELAVWNCEQVFSCSENEDMIDVLTMAQSENGNRIMAGVSVSSTSVNEEIRTSFRNLARVILLVFVVLFLVLDLVLYKRISVPAKEISRTMTEYMKEGTRSSKRIGYFGEDELGLIAGSFNSMADSIDTYLENIRTLSSEKERQEAELDIASAIQMGFLSPNFMASKNCEIHALMKSARDVGGDLYDYVQLDDERTLIVIADVSGKGMAAALMMAVVLITVRQYAKLGQSPSQILYNVNNLLSERNPRLMFVTAFAAIYDASDKTLTFSNGGHNPPYLLSDTLHELNTSSGTLIGLFKDEKYSEETIHLRTGDILFLYTDGVSEATNSERAFYGTKRLENTLIDAWNENKNDLVEVVRNSLADFAGGAEPHDDITMLTLTVKQSLKLLLDVDKSEFEKIKEPLLLLDVPRSLKLELCVAAEECFINICSYAYPEGVPSGEKIIFTLEHSDRIVLRFEDYGIQYDPRESVTDPEEYDIDNQLGGLGKLIAFTVADEIDYEYTDGKNILTITKYKKEGKVS